LFSIFLNDLESYLQSKDVSGLITLSEEIENQLNVYLKLFVILYADDTVIMSETKEDLQKQLDVFSEYCKFWQLKVNVEKTKILVFSPCPTPFSYLKKSDLQLLYTTHDLMLSYIFNIKQKLKFWFFLEGGFQII
jgi:predicted site-specific integrase-resolvase